MRLHRTITTDRPLFVVALEEEAAHLHAHDLPVLVTGVGKVNAALAVSAILRTYSPTSLINVGTAGALRDGVEGLHRVSHVIQHDLDGTAIFSLTGHHVSPELRISDEPGVTLATGDQFINDAQTRARIGERAHLVDMEGYAIASAALAMNVPVTIVKYVSDSADSGAARSWRDTVDHCAVQLGAWVEAELDAGRLR